MTSDHSTCIVCNTTMRPEYKPAHSAWHVEEDKADHGRFCEVQYAKPPFLGPISCGCFDRASDLTDQEWQELVENLREQE